MNSLDRQQMVLFVLGLAQPGTAGGPSVLNLCPAPKSGHKDDLVTAAYSGVGP